MYFIKPILTPVSILFCTIIFAQETKPCQFIGIYEKSNRGICVDYELVKQEINDYPDYNIKRTQFLEAHKSKSPNTRFIDKNENVIVYQYEKKIACWNCTSNVISAKIGKSLEVCNKQLAKQHAENPKDLQHNLKLFLPSKAKKKV